MKRYFLSLFAGIGGFDLGAERAGLKFDGHYYSEIEPYACKVMRTRFPEAINLGDVTKIDVKELLDGDWIIAGGFPCQDISAAGKGAGLAGARSGLWFEYLRIVEGLRPSFAVIENVGALVSRGLDQVLESLAEVGYDAEWQDIRASDVGAPHRRERIWIVAYPGSTRSRCESGAACADRGRGTGRDESALRPSHREDGADRLDSTSSAEEGALADADAIMRDGSGGTRDRRIESTDCREDVADAQDGGDVRRDGELEPAQEQVRLDRGSPKHGGREWWATEPDVGRVAHGVPSRVDRLRCLGNSIVPQVAELIFRDTAFDRYRS